VAAQFGFESHLAIPIQDAQKSPRHLREFSRLSMQLFNKSVVTLRPMAGAPCR